MELQETPVSQSWAEFCRQQWNWIVNLYLQSYGCIKCFFSYINMFTLGRKMLCCVWILIYEWDCVSIEVYVKPCRPKHQIRTHVFMCKIIHQYLSHSISLYCVLLLFVADFFWNFQALLELNLPFYILTHCEMQMILLKDLTEWRYAGINLAWIGW